MIVILGAGPCGLSVGYHLQAAGQTEFRILEQSSSAGGICRSLMLRAGGSVDCGGHAFFTDDAPLRMLMQQHNGDRLVWQSRRAIVAIGGHIVRYPIQAHLRDLPSDLATTYLADFDKCRTLIGDENQLRGWLLARFGEKLCDEFFIPYAEKLWAHPIDQLLVDSTTDRIVQPTVADMQTGGTDDSEFKDYPNAVIGLSKTGRFWDLYQWLERSVVDHVEFNSPVTDINLDQRQIEFGGGRNIEFETLVSTIPLDRLAGSCSAPASISALAAQLAYNSLHLVTFTIDRHSLIQDVMRLYCADEDVPFHKLVIQPLVVSADHVVPSERLALQAEVAFSNHKQVPLSSLVDVCRESIVKLGMVHPAASLRFERLDTIQRAYPVATTSSHAARNQLVTWFEQQGVFCGGRFGRWEYINSDRAFQQGRDLADVITRHHRLGSS